MADRIPDGITREHILAAIDDLKRGVHHRFGASTTYDLLQDGQRFPPKAVLGLAAGRVTGEPLGPYDFKAGLHSKCFRILEENGFTIVPKDAAAERLSTPNGSAVTRIASLPNESTLVREGLHTEDGVLRWPSQPKQGLAGHSIQNLIAHNEDTNSIYLFLRTASRRNGIAPPYTYLGRLKYQTHDREREQPVYFMWKILDWNIPDQVRERIDLQYEGAAPSNLNEIPVVLVRKGLIQVSGPTGTPSRRGLSTSSYSRRIIRDYVEQDARNRHLGLAGEEAVIESERNALVACGRSDLAELIFHVAKIEGDGAGFDIKSYTPAGKEKFIEVKTTCGDKATAFYLSSNEARFAADHADSYYLYRVFEFDQSTSSGKVFVQSGDLQSNFSISPVQFKALPAFD